MFSRPGKLELIDAAFDVGYRIVLYHVNLRHPDLSVARVGARVATGGHFVPEDKIRARYERNQPRIRQAAERASITMVYDNSRRGCPPRWLLPLEYGRLLKLTGGEMPDWAERPYLLA